jgi:hypothetical protein
MFTQHCKPINSWRDKGPDGVLYTADEIHAMTLVNLHEEFATIITTAELLSMHA